MTHVITFALKGEFRKEYPPRARVLNVLSEENAGRSLSGGRAPGDTRPDTVTRPMGSSNGPKGADGPKGSAICRLWPPLVVGAALLFMLSTSPDTTPPQARLGAGASYRRAGEFALRERKLEAAVSLDVPGERQPALRLSDVDTEAPADLGSGDSDDPGAPGVYALTADDIDGRPVHLSVLSGKPTLMINVASE